MIEADDKSSVIIGAEIVVINGYINFVQMPSGGDVIISGQTPTGGYNLRSGVEISLVSKVGNIPNFPRFLKDGLRQVNKADVVSGEAASILGMLHYTIRSHL